MSGKSIPTLEKEAVEALKKGKREKAVEKYTSLLELCPDNTARWLCARGKCTLEMGKAEDAMKDGKAAIEADSQCLEAYVLAGKAAYKQHMFIEALDFFKAGLKINPQCNIITEELKKMQKIILEDNREKSKGAETSYSALSLCSQNIYPGDDKLLNMEKEILQVKYKILDDEAYRPETVQMKQPSDEQLEMQLIQAAGESFDANRLEDALNNVSKAITLSPKNIFLRTFRAQIHFDLKQWASTIQDYWVIPKPQRTAEVWSQGGKALLELWLPVLAEFWFRKATQLSGGKDEEAAILFQQVRVKRLYDPLTEEYPVKVDFTKFGRAVFAKEDIAAGDVVMKDVPMVMSQSLTSKHVPACWNCAISLISPRDYFGIKMTSMSNDLLSLIEEHWPVYNTESCPHCNRELYCSKLCRQEAWSVYHRVICPHENKEGHQLYDLMDNNGFGHTAEGEWTSIWGGHFSFMILVKVWAIIVSQVQTLMTEEGLSSPTVEHWARAKAPFRRFIAYGVVPATQRMPHVLPVFQAVFKNCGAGLTFDITEEEFNGRYYQAGCNLQCFSPSITPYHNFINNIKEDMRAIGMIKYLTDTPPEAEFAAMCPLHACTNHSCYNNAEVSDIDLNGRPGVQMIARRNIKKGEEIFITYIDTNVAKLLRRAWLYKSFNFWCQCQRCQFEGEHADECTNCQKRSEGSKPFPACSNCKKAWYCGVKCQKENWKKGHKTICQATHSKVDFDSHLLFPYTKAKSSNDATNAPKQIECRK